MSSRSSHRSRIAELRDLLRLLALGEVEQHVSEIVERRHGDVGQSEVRECRLGRPLVLREDCRACAMTASVRLGAREAINQRPCTAA